VSEARWALRVDERGVTPGGIFTAVAALTLEPGWHVNSCRPAAPELIPTVVAPVPGGVFSLAAPPTESTTHLVFDASLGQQVAQHEGQAEFTLSLRVANGAPLGPHELIINASTQLCSDLTCLPPVLTTLAATVEVVAP